MAKESKRQKRRAKKREVTAKRLDRQEKAAQESEEEQIPPSGENAPPAGEPAGKTPPEKEEISVAEILPAQSLRSACYIDYENLFYTLRKMSKGLNVPRLVRLLNRMSRNITGEGFFKTAVYANWDSMLPEYRRAQDDWSVVGWRTISVPAKEDYWSGHPIKNLVDFVMSMDLVEDSYTTDISLFFILSGDNDFVEAVERLKRRGKKVIVVSLKPNLSFRLQEAADEAIILNADELTGDEPLPTDRYKSGLLTGQYRKKHREEPYDEFQFLIKSIQLAERDQNVSPIAWSVVRDEYFLKQAKMTVPEADKFIHSLSEAGYVQLIRRTIPGKGTFLFVGLSRLT